MSSIVARICNSTYNAPAKTVAAAETAARDGYSGVHTGYDPQTATHTVHADDTGVEHARNTLNRILGR